MSPRVSLSYARLKRVPTRPWHGRVHFRFIKDCRISLSAGLVVINVGPNFSCKFIPKPSVSELKLPALESAG